MTAAEEKRPQRVRLMVVGGDERAAAGWPPWYDVTHVMRGDGSRAAATLARGKIDHVILMSRWHNGPTFKMVERAARCPVHRWPGSVDNLQKHITDVIGPTAPKAGTDGPPTVEPKPRPAPRLKRRDYFEAPAGEAPQPGALVEEPAGVVAWEPAQPDALVRDVATIVRHQVEDKNVADRPNITPVSVKDFLATEAAAAPAPPPPSAELMLFKRVREAMAAENPRANTWSNDELDALVCAWQETREDANADKFLEVCRTLGITTAPTTDSSDGRFSRIEVDQDAPAAPAPTPAPIVSTVAPTLGDAGVVSRGQTIDPEGKARVRSDYDDLKAAGFVLRDTVVPEGTMVVEMGIKNYTRSAQKWEAMPWITDAARAFEGIITQERRSTDVVDMPGTWMEDDGKIHHANLIPIAIDSRAVSALQTRAAEMGGAYVAALHSSPQADHVKLAAHNLNYHLRRSITSQGKPRNVMFRTRDQRDLETGLRSPSQGREIFAAVGPDYQMFDADKVANCVAAAAGEQAKGTVRYDGHSATVDVVFHSAVAASKVVAGEAFKLAVRARTADDGSGSVVLSAMAWRNLCVNLIIIDTARVVTGRIAHRWNAEKMTAEISAAFARAHKKLEKFINRWDAIRMEDILAQHGLGEMREAFTKMVDARLVWVSGVTRDEMVDRLMSAWGAEGGSSKADALNAITRAAHTQTWASSSTPDYLEKRAGELLYQPVWNLEAAI